jgi:hypothetical protein
MVRATISLAPFPFTRAGKRGSLSTAEVDLGHRTMTLRMIWMTRRPARI